MLVNTSTLPAIKAPVIFLPGTLCDERIFIPLWQQMNLDQRSYVPLQWADTHENMLALTADRLNSFNERVHIVAYSMGAYIGALAALDGQFNSNIASLSFIGYNPYGLSEQETRGRMQILKAIKQKKFKGLDSAKLQQYFTPSEIEQSNNNLPLVQTVLDMEADLGASVLYGHIDSTTPRKDLANKLAKLNITQLWISAQHDQIAPAAKIEQFCSTTKQAKHHNFSNTAHMMPLTCTNELAQLLTQHILAHS